MSFIVHHRCKCHTKSHCCNSFFGPVPVLAHPPLLYLRNGINILTYFVGSCNISPYEMPATWYDHTSKISRQKTMEKEPWRQNILANLVNNNFHAKSYVTYEDAIERSSWSKKAIVTFNLGEGGRKFEQVNI